MDDKIKVYTIQPHLMNDAIGAVITMREHLRMLKGHKDYGKQYAEYVEWCLKFNIDTEHLTIYL